MGHYALPHWDVNPSVLACDTTLKSHIGSNPVISAYEREHDAVSGREAA